ncbi:MAG: PASTA domain-containing protein [Parabacteroides sp.]|nr:PASTA domain-containing protein [Parabacteroides sp.]MDD3358270.1 PASTA domain-containing protein [Parabacteroides sp.]MDD4404789.1 PASTA domain-containing protein [Parabacteroides sp.]
MKEYIIKILKNPFVFNLLLAGVITLVLLGGVMFWLSSYTRHNEAVVVPDVRGLKVEEAAEYFDRSNLRYNVIDSVFSSDVPAGAIVEMIPEAGAKVKDGRIVFITINASTTQMAPMPNVQDLSFRQAQALLEATGFNSVEIEYVPGDYKDLVVGVEHRGRMLSSGEKVSLKAALVLKISNGEGEMLPTTTDSTAVEELDSEEENWF